MPSKRAEIIKKCLHRIKPMLAKADVEGNRAAQDRLGNMTFKMLGERIVTQQIAFKHFEAYLIDPSGQPEDDRVVLYLHGGGYIAGGFAYARGTGGTMAANLGLRTLCFAYRLAPEHPFPAGLEDCLAVAGWLAASGRPWGVSGTSAGANLAIATALARRHAPGPGAMVLFYGVFGADLDTGSYTAFGDGRYGLSRERMANFFEMYDPPGARTRDPLITPLLGDLAGLPPTWLLAAGLDVLRDDTLAMHERLQAAGVETRLRIEPGCVHGFINRGRIVRAARESLADAAAFLRQSTPEWRRRSPPSRPI